MTPLKIHNGGSYALMEYLTCWKCVIFHAVTALVLYEVNNSMSIINEKYFESLNSQLNI